MKIAFFIKEEIAETELPTMLISKISEHDLDFDPDNPDVVIFVGGDGTFLRAVQEYIDKVDNVLFAGINEGSLGFYADYVADEIDRLLDDLVDGSFVTHSARLLEARIQNNVYYAVNEVRLENPFHTMTGNVFVNGQYFETYRGNGLSICSTLGSSAYNKSLGGSVIVPELETLQISEIAPINNRVYRSFGSSLVLPKEDVITLEGDFSEAVVGYDHLTADSEPRRVEIRLSHHRVTLIYKKEHSFVKRFHEAFIK